jgi:hypothetical protein
VEGAGTWLLGSMKGIQKVKTGTIGISVNPDYGCRRCPFRCFRPGFTKQGRTSRDRSKGVWLCLVTGNVVSKGWRARAYEVPESCPLKDHSVVVRMKQVRKVD